jgi:enolase
MATIRRIVGREILDSRGDSTLEVDVTCDDGSFGRASVPSGASTGSHEAQKLTDIPKSIANVEVVAQSLIGHRVDDQSQVDLLLMNTDGTEEKSNLGANVTLAISLAVAEAAAVAAKQPLYAHIQQLSKTRELKLPTPMFNVINGGKHADSGLPFQEFMVIPAPDRPYHEQLRMGQTVFHQLKATLAKLGHRISVGDEGGFAPQLASDEEAIELLIQAIQACSFQAGTDVLIGLDVAASSIPDLAPVTYPLKPHDYFVKLVGDYPILVLEDPLPEDDWEGWVQLTAAIGSRVRVVGDDLFTTNPRRVQKGIELKAANSVLVKPDQIGTLTETLQTIALARQASMEVAISHRSGETESTFIADLAVGTAAELIKTGGLSRGERIAKYNQLLRIEAALQGNQADRSFQESAVGGA